MLQIMALTHNMLGNFHTIAPLFTNYTLSIHIPIWLWLLLRKSFFSIQIFYSYLIYLVMLWSPMLAVSGWTGPNWWTQSAELPPLFLPLFILQMKTDLMDDIIWDENIRCWAVPPHVLLLLLSEMDFNRDCKLLMIDLLTWILVHSCYKLSATN